MLFSCLVIHVACSCACEFCKNIFSVSATWNWCTKWQNSSGGKQPCCPVSCCQDKLRTPRNKFSKSAVWGFMSLCTALLYCHLQLFCTSLRMKCTLNCHKQWHECHSFIHSAASGESSCVDKLCRMTCTLRDQVGGIHLLACLLVRWPRALRVEGSQGCSWI